MATSHPRVTADPPPVAIFQQFGDSALVFQLRAWVDNVDDWLTTGSELHSEVAAAFEAEGIEIPFPQRDVHIRPALSSDTSSEAARGAAPREPEK